MEELVKQLGAFWGPAGIICGLLLLAVVYLYKRVESLQKENVDTLKLVLPMIEKFQTTIDTTLRVVSKKGNDQ